MNLVVPPPWTYTSEIKLSSTDYTRPYLPSSLKNKKVFHCISKEVHLECCHINRDITTTFVPMNLVVDGG